MPFAPGTRLGVYDIIAPIGEGGMGQVYRARDTRLDRDVAIKILPEAFAQDGDRLARFQREAKTLASLNHPHIAAIYGLEESGGVSALVMELVSGEDLSQRIARGAMPLDEALPIAKQMAEALEAAHEQGIIHRDLKPANIKVRSDGTVKVLDFGLAKAMDQGSGARDQGSGHASMSPTITTPAMTQAGMILGTAAYMSPEQAKGRPVDRRADVWAFGAVLYEMLSGHRAFEGEDIADTLANVLKAEPDWSRLPVAVPLGVRQTLRASLQKDPKQRIGDMQSARLALEGAFETAGRHEATVVHQPARWWRVAAVGVATAIVGGLITGTVAWRFRALPAPAIVTFPFVLPEDQVLTRPPSIALSPDGTRIAYVANEQIYVRSMNEMESRPIPGTNFDPYRPFFSPDSQWIAFFSFRDNTLKKIGIAGGSALTICKVSLSNIMYGASWDGDQIVFADPGKGIMRVSANAGEPIVLAEVKPPEVPDGPQMLDDDTLLFTTTAESGPTRWDKAQIVVQSLRSGERKIVFRGGTGRYVPTGHLVYALGTTLLAAPFDVAAREVRGGPVALLEGVRRAAIPATQSGVAGFGLSPTGALVYLPGTADTSARNILASVDRTGKTDPLLLAAQPYLHPRMSPKGDQLAVATDDGRDANVWIVDIKSGGSARRLTFGGRNLFPIWTPDGRSVTFQSDRDGDRGIFQQLADGSGVAERLTKGEQGSVAREAPESWSPDGKTLVFRVGSSPATMSLWMLTTGDKAPKRFDETVTAGHFNSSFSPDGRWLSYSSTEASPGSSRIFVQPFPRTGAKYQLTSTDSASPQWSPDGRQIIYDEGQYTRRLMALDVRTTPSFTFGNPTPIPTPGMDKPAGYWRPYDLALDGKRIIMVSSPQADSKGAVPRTQINVVLNWFEELKARVPTK